MALTFQQLCDLVVAIKPSLAPQQMKPEHSLIDDLGLDSLDLMQLGRRVQRAAGVPFLLETWSAEEQLKPGPQHTLRSLLDAVTACGSPGA